MMLLRTICVLGLLGWLAGCGGGGGSNGPAPLASCALPLTYIAGLSGVGIPESSPVNWTSTTADVTRTISSCAIQQLQQAQINICIEASNISQLDAQLVPPSAPAVSLALQSATSTQGCTGVITSTSGKLWTLTLSGTLLSNITNFNGNWLVQVRDGMPDTNTSTLVGWSLNLAGVR